MTHEEIIAKLELLPHPTEGGYFRRTYESDLKISIEGRSRKLLSSIYYLLTRESPQGYLHRNKSDIIHYYQMGSPLLYVIVSPEGRIEEHVLGHDLAHGERLQLVVKGGDWKASRLCRGDYGLISEAVAPGFEYADNEIATLASISSLFPGLVSRLEPYIKRQSV